MTSRFLFFPFLLGLILSQKLYLVGQLYVGEIVAIIYLIFNFKRIKFVREVNLIIVFALLWAFAQFISDLSNQTLLNDSIKGVLAPVLFIISMLFFLIYIKKNYQRLPSLLIGLIAGQLLHLLLVPTDYFIGNFWKWGFGTALIGLFTVYFSFFIKRRNNIFLSTVLVIFLVISLNFDARSLALIPFLGTLVYIAFFGAKKSFLKERFFKRFIVLKIVLIASPVIFLVDYGAVALFSSQVFLSSVSSDKVEKYRTQAIGEYGILIGGRSEILASAQAFLDKPILGHGSWAKDKSGYLDGVAILRRNLGYTVGGGYEGIGEEIYIPAHSYLMGSLVWAGILGGLFWLIVLNNTMKIFLNYMSVLPLYFYIGFIGLLWNIFFSPFGANARWESAIFLASLYSFVNYININIQVRK